MGRFIHCNVSRTNHRNNSTSKCLSVDGAQTNSLHTSSWRMTSHVSTSTRSLQTGYNMVGHRLFLFLEFHVLNFFLFNFHIEIENPIGDDAWLITKWHNCVKRNRLQNTHYSRALQAHRLIVVVFNIFRLQALEAFGWNVGHQCEQFVGGVFIVVSSASQTDADTEWCAPAYRQYHST